MKTNAHLKIGALSERTAVSIATIRYYERTGLLPKRPRSAGGHRLFADEHKQRLIFIRRARELGFSPDEVRTLLDLASGRRMTYAKVKTISDRYLADIRNRRTDLKRLERVLIRMVNQCRAGEMADCPILEALGR